MRNIEVKLLNRDAPIEAERMMVAMARLTQRGHQIKCMDDLMELLDKPYKPETADRMCQLPHPTIQKFGLLNIAIVGASRRFLAQITRHQNEIKFMSGSLQYSDYSDDAQFVVPYAVTEADYKNPMYDAYGKVIPNWHRNAYLNSCAQAMAEYKKAVEYIGNDAAGYMAPQGLRNVLIMSVQPFELKHIISQRCCNRNTKETQYVLLKIWEQLYEYTMFTDCGPNCICGTCQEGNMCCGHPMHANESPTSILHREFKYLYETEG